MRNTAATGTERSFALSDMPIQTPKRQARWSPLHLVTRGHRAARDSPS